MNSAISSSMSMRFPRRVLPGFLVKNGPCASMRTWSCGSLGKGVLDVCEVEVPAEHDVARPGDDDQVRLGVVQVEVGDVPAEGRVALDARPHLSRELLHLD